MWQMFDPDFLDFLILNNMLMYMDEAEKEDLGYDTGVSESLKEQRNESAGCMGCAGLFILVAIISVIMSL